MKIKFARLQNFRNVAFAEIDLDADSVWICGANAQGKTNLLEALGLLAAARSFRTSDISALVKKGEKSAAALFGVLTEETGDSEILIEISKTRKISVDGAEIGRLGDFIGRFPALPMTSEDVKILRGSPETRRRDVDMFISGIDPEYFDALRRYHSALGHRNALLRAEETADELYSPFEIQMARAAETVSQKRRERLAQMAQIAGERYARLARGNGEGAEIEMKPSSEAEGCENFREMLARERAGDIERRATRRGPHRDDFPVRIGGLDAKTYASEGQQRSAALAIKLAQFEIFKAEKGIEPAILCDDILGELDAARRAAFWECVPPSAQVISTATSDAPDCAARKSWKTVRVENGKYFS